ncbi:hypothetical protein Mycch_0399 [Mycolicibacterium chubuense NBB4]|uniref:Uncharacterized protein n=1 Tax=Mycolicibacterium chubuense (strain NBB4) TaxID=710421 RepID=I4BD62_MYCCN|nr:IniB N-terminal domain-containing protein [Mycolicibacterium chubuense]AFM15219.1 hypothetical protein Mycch_0399 [Mycolicibacterium chubuense NBB4]
MANPLLDFVMSVVHDPDVAARYAADPAQAIADAHLTGVTSADVASLIPVVSDSLPMATSSQSSHSSQPAHTLDHFGAGPAANVWASGAATAAFDAFDDHVPAAGVIDPHIDTHPVVTDIDDHALAGPDLSAAPELVDHGVSLQFDEPVIPDAVSTDHAVPGLVDDWTHTGADTHPADHVPGFDIFD